MEVTHSADLRTQTLKEHINACLVDAKESKFHCLGKEYILERNGCLILVLT